MPISDYLRELRRHVGSALLMMPAATAVIHNDEGNVLVVYSEDGFWGTPGGALDPGESAAEAIVREVREELGVEVEPERVLAVYSIRIKYPNDDEVAYTSTAFRCRLVSGEIEAADGEILDWEWVPPAEVVARGIPLPVHVLPADYEGPAAF